MEEKDWARVVTAATRAPSIHNTQPWRFVSSPDRGEGLVASPLTQALDWPATRHRLTAQLSLVGHPQMLLRMGYPTTPDAGTPSGRRPVAEVLRFEPAG